MKAARFAYVRAESISHASALLRHDPDARLLAGGQTLLAALNMRLSQPTLLIDITSLESMRHIEMHADTLSIGALVRHVDIERSALIAARHPLLAMAAPHVAHAAVRNRGTLGGSIAFADPAAEWPACALAADADIVMRNDQHERRITAGDFFIDLYETDLKPDELIVSIEFPLPNPHRRFAFAELSRRHGDYAIVGIALAADVIRTQLQDVRIVYFGVGNTPVRALAAETALTGSDGHPDVVTRAVKALDEDMRPDADIYTSGAAKRHMAGVLLQRALRQLLQEDAS